MVTPNLARTPLHGWHSSHGGRMVEFGGWSMPVQYSSIIAEHTATRSAVGLFDISHMGRLRFDGPQAREFLDGLLTRRVTDMAPGRIRYGLITNDEGGILDDVLVYHLQDGGGGSYYLLVVNASNRGKVLHWLEPRLAAEPDVYLTDVTLDWAMIAVQGPRAVALVQPFLSDCHLERMKYYTGRETRIAGHAGIVSRTGYTGEDGCELIVGGSAVVELWDRLVSAGRDIGAVPAGLGSRDTLRLEAAMPLYGHELSEQIDPYQAGLAFAVDLEGRDFPGRAALARLKDAPPRGVRVGLELEGRRVPREGHPVLAGGAMIGRVTSGTFSPTFQKPIAMAYVEPAAAKVGTSVQIEVRGQHEPGRMVELPFYRRKSV